MEKVARRTIRGLLQRLGACLAFGLAALLPPAPASANDKPEGDASRMEPEAGKVWIAGAYSFSDELGGFRITAASGTGSRSDPIVITEELESATPSTLVIRTVRPIRPFASADEFATGFFHLRIVALNNSRLPWIEFEFELQERLGQASVFGDGLSFNQRRTDESADIHSDRYARFNRNFEPYDRLRFADGQTDFLQTSRFGFFVTDFTPRWEFYLVQDPRIPSS